MENTNTKDWSVDDSDDELMLATEVDVDLRKYRFAKRAPVKPVLLGRHDLMVSSSTPMAALVTKVCTSLNEDSNAIVTLHALGNAIPMAIDLALLIVHKYHKQVIASTNTSTVALQDDYIPLSEHSDLPPVTQVRFSSAVHIRLMHRVPTNTAGS